MELSGGNGAGAACGATEVNYLSAYLDSGKSSFLAAL